MSPPTRNTKDLTLWFFLSCPEGSNPRFKCMVFAIYNHAVRSIYDFSNFKKSYLQFSFALWSIDVCEHSAIVFQGRPVINEHTITKYTNVNYFVYSTIQINSSLTRFNLICYDGFVKKFLSGFIFLLLLVLPAIVVAPARASSQQAYQDYLYQFDVYRQKYNDFQIAKNSFDKFKTLESESQALSATKFMLSQRDLLLHAYLIYLFERVGEQGGITPVNKQLYQSLLTNELAFLEKQSSLVSSINSIDDATTASEELESHYQVLSATIREIIAGISLGQLNVIAQNFDRQVTVAQSLFSRHSTELSTEKKSMINTWILQITNKRSLYQQKIDETNAAVADLTNSNDANDLDQRFSDVIIKIGEAKQYMSDSIANLGEVVTSLQYVN